MNRLAVALMIAACAANAQALSLDQIAVEPDLERRSRFAVEFAQAQVGIALSAYQEADGETARAALAKIPKAVDISQTSLTETGKHARKKHIARSILRTPMEQNTIAKDMKLKNKR